MKWNEISIKTVDGGVDVVSSLLNDLNVDGTEIVGGGLPESGDWDYIDDQLVQEYDRDDVIIKAYFVDDQHFLESFDMLKKGLAHLKSIEGDTDDFGALELLLQKRDESEWAENWKQYFKPFKAGEKIVVCPEWEKYDKKDDEIVLKIDPGAAFGSGLHETTKMCILELEKFVDENSFVYDVGCGSGILAIAATKLGAKKAIAVDRDTVCVEVAKENCEINGVLDKIDVGQADLLAGVVEKKANIVVANIIADIIIRLNDSVKAYMADDAVYIMSGIIADRLGDVLKSLGRLGFNVINITKMGEWRCVTAMKK
jgi:ribosomal protein L11 methyltransferase